MSTQPANIDFIKNHQPYLKTGEYRITLEQSLEVTGTATSPIPTTQQTFTVAGERFQLTPAAIQSVFPPKHSAGEHSHVLPHLMLTRSTLPWERQSKIGDENTPWLALLLIHESEQEEVDTKVVSLQELQTTSDQLPVFPKLELEPSQSEEDKVSVLDIPKELLEKIMPSASDLQWLSHVRQGKDASGEIVGKEVATLVANRLPEAGKSNTAYLVSLENRFDSSGSFNYDGAGASDKVRLVTLHSWDFTSTKHFKVSEHHLHRSSLSATLKFNLSKLIGKDYYSDEAFEKALKEEAGLTQNQFTSNKNKLFQSFSFGDFAAILKHLDRNTETIRLPDVGKVSTDEFLKMGFYPLPHQLRQGGQTVSWYHGPLSPKSNTETMAFPAKSSDELVRFYEAQGMFDVSYAAAWELGRLLALQNTHFSTELYQWKRQFAHNSHQEKQRNNPSLAHLQVGAPKINPPSFSPTLTKWFEKLELLEGIPFNYLIPDEALLPVESIRFFQLDELWMKALTDGAFSIGRVSSADHALDIELLQQASIRTSKPISGFILRSEVVAGWPDLLIDGYNTVPASNNQDAKLNAANSMPLLQRKKLSPNILLCLFEGDLQTLDLHLQPEALHFGLSVNDNDSGYEKRLRNDSGQELDAYKVNVELEEERVLKMDQLVLDIQNKYNTNNQLVWTAQPNSEQAPPPNSQNLAIQLLEGVEKVRFIKG